MQETVTENMWSQLAAYMRSTFDPNVLLMDLFAVAAVLLAAWIILFLGRKLIGRLVKVASGEERKLDANMTQTLRILIETLFSYSIYILTALGVLHIFNLDLISSNDFKNLISKIIQSLIIFAIAKAVLRIGKILVDHWFAAERRSLIGKKRAKTLGVLLLSILRYLVFFIAGIMVLQTCGVQTGSILASAGIAGLAVGFGAQNLVKDIISGFFILFEDQFSVGEYVTVAGITGTVEELGIRSTTIREWTGHLYTIPNGEIVQVKNFERGPILAVVTISIAYEADIDRAIEVIKEHLGKLFHEQDCILEMPTVLGVEALSEFSVDLLVTAKCNAGTHWAVEREMRKRIKEALDLEGVPIPFPARTMYHSVGEE